MPGFAGMDVLLLYRNTVAEFRPSVPFLESRTGSDHSSGATVSVAVVEATVAAVTYNGRSPSGIDAAHPVGTVVSFLRLNE